MSEGGRSDAEAQIGQVEQYVRAVSKRVKLPPDEREQFREELRAHLLDAVKELRREQGTEEESVAEALRRFGPEKRLNAEFRRAVRPKARPHGRFGRLLLLVAGLLFGASVVLLAVYGFMEETNRVSFDGMQAEYHTEVAEQLQTGGPAADEALAAFVRRYERIVRFVSVAPAAEAYGGSEEAGRTFPAGVTAEQRDKQPYITYYTGVAGGDERTEVRIGLKRETLFSPLPGRLLVSAGVCFVMYWVLFAAGGTLHARRAGRLNVGWIVLFFTLNIVAFGLLQWHVRRRGGWRRPVILAQWVARP